MSAANRFGDMFRRAYAEWQGKGPLPRPRIMAKTCKQCAHRVVVCRQYDHAFCKVYDVPTWFADNDPDRCGPQRKDFVNGRDARRRPL
jgi:hypothetical protein